MVEKWMLRVPKDDKAEEFIRLFKKYLNTEGYKVIKRYTGKRPKGTNQHSTKEENATSTRLYIEPKEKSESFDYAKSARPVTHMPGSIAYTSTTNAEQIEDKSSDYSKWEEGIKQEVHSTINKTRLSSRIATLEYRVEDLEMISDKHRELNGRLRAEANDLLDIAMGMFKILEKIDFSSTGINTCYDEVPWNYIEETLNKYGK